MHRESGLRRAQKRREGEGGHGSDCETSEGRRGSERLPRGGDCASCWGKHCPLRKTGCAG